MQHVGVKISYQYQFRLALVEANQLKNYWKKMKEHFHIFWLLYLLRQDILKWIHRCHWKGSSSCRQPLLTLTSLPQGKIDVCSVIALNSFAVWGKLVNKCSITRWLPRLPVGSQAASKQWRPDLVQSLTNRSQHSAINWSESVLMSATGLRCLTIGHLTKLVLEWLYYGYISLCFFKCLNSCS